jgi:hypothetical protein
MHYNSRSGNCYMPGLAFKYEVERLITHYEREASGQPLHKIKNTET